MRLVPSTRHALAAVALAALAAGSAPAADYFLLLKDVKGVTSTAGLQSFSWGASSRPRGGDGGGIYARTVNLNSSKSNREIAVSDPGADGPKTPKALAAVDAAGPGGGGGGGAGGSAQVARIDRETAKLEARVAPADLDGDGRADIAAGAAKLQSSENIAVVITGSHRAVAPAGAVTSPRDSASGLATGKRQHGQVKLTTTLDKSSPLLALGQPSPQPSPAGSLTVAGSLPGCAVGATYPEAALEGAGKRYELKEVMITSCATGQLTLDYARVEVRGWDLKTNEK